MPIRLAHPDPRLLRLLEITQRVLGTLDPDELLAELLTAVQRLCAAEGCSLALLDPTTQELAFAVMVGPAQVPPFRLAKGQGIDGWVVQTGHGVICNDVIREPRFFRGVDAQTGYTTRSLLCAPLQQHDQLLG